jgi:hypothetical protein
VQNVALDDSDLQFRTPMSYDRLIPVDAAPQSAKAQIIRPNYTQGLSLPFPAESTEQRHFVHT